MFALVDFGLILIFALSLTAVYFAFEKIITFRALSFLRVRKYIIDTVTGIFFGLFTILLSVILKSLDKDFTIPLYFIVGIVFMVVRNINTAAPAFIIALIYDTFQNDFANIDYYIISSFAIISTIKLILEFYLEQKWSNLSVVIGVLMMGLIGIPIMGSALEYSYNRVTFENSILLSVATAAVYYPFRTAVRFSISANLLFESVNFIYSRYYRAPLLQGAIGSYISQNKTDKAIFALFEIKVSGEKDSDEKTEVVEMILSKVETYFNDDTTLFSHDQNIYGFFMPLDGEVDLKKVIEGNKTNHPQDVLGYIMGLSEEVVGPYETSRHNIVDTDIKIGTSIYGVQSNSLLRLERNALSALRQTNWDAENKVINFSFENFRNKLTDSSRLTLMDENLDLNNFANRYKALLNNDGEYTDIQYVTVENISDYELVQDVDELVRVKRWKPTFDRYFASEAISKNRELSDRLMLEYSHLLKQTDNEYEEFKEKLSLLKVDLNRIILVISQKDIDQDNKHILMKLGKDGIQWALKDWINPGDVKALMPSFVIVDKSNLEKSRDIEAIKVAPFIKNELELLNMLKNKVDLLGGYIIQDRSNVKKPNKQSKIYIEGLTSKIKGEQ